MGSITAGGVTHWLPTEFAEGMYWRSQYSSVCPLAMQPLGSAAAVGVVAANGMARHAAITGSVIVNR